MTDWLSASATNYTCVEVKRDGDRILIRDGKDPGGPVLTFTLPEWAAFTTGVTDGRFDPLTLEG